MEFRGVSQIIKCKFGLLNKTKCMLKYTKIWNLNKGRAST